MPIAVSNLLTYLPPAVAHALAGYPPWLVIASLVVAALLALWVLGKVLKWTLYLLLILLLVGAGGFAIWMLLNAFHLLPAAGS
jgi:hypothetical protein